MRLILVSLLALVGCATTDARTQSERCQDDARANYQQCLNPNFVPEGEPLPVRTSQESQSCRIAYQQALARCGDGEEIPLIPIGTGTGTSTKTGSP